MGKRCTVLQKCWIHAYSLNGNPISFFLGTVVCSLQGHPQVPKTTQVVWWWLILRWKLSFMFGWHFSGVKDCVENVVFYRGVRKDQWEQVMWCVVLRKCIHFPLLFPAVGMYEARDYVKQRLGNGCMFVWEERIRVRGYCPCLPRLEAMWQNDPPPLRHNH